MADFLSLADRINDLLPQTQCGKCSYHGCRPYAEAIAEGTADINQCPPGGAQGITRLASLLDKKLIPLNPVNGRERPRPVAVIDEALCIGCTLCIQACPVDAIVGAAKQMHTVIPELCTGCDLCVAPCPVDCIAMLEVTPGKTGWDTWSQAQADAARARYQARGLRLQREQTERAAMLAAKAALKIQAAPTSESANAEQLRKQALIQAAIERVKLAKQNTASQPDPAANSATPDANHSDE